MLIATFTGNAAKFSYVYIQGDKETPFYVKLEDEMLPRYGKNYSIISNLAPGPIHIKILFQQNAYPEQSFTILVPENGYRGFILTKKDEEFSLYDIQQQFYLSSGNREEEDKAPAYKPDDNYLPTNTVPVSDNPIIIKKSTPIEHEELTIASAPVVEKQVNGPEFMDIELKKDPEANADNTLPGGADKNERQTKTSQCTKAIDTEFFDAILKKVNDKNDKAKLKYLLTKMPDNCFTTNQIRILTRTLPNDPEKYTFLKNAYPKVTDRAQFPKLVTLLTTEEWKTYFKLIVQ